jgi:hypothetical protein
MDPAEMESAFAKVGSAACAVAEAMGGTMNLASDGTWRSMIETPGAATTASGSGWDEGASEPPGR